MRARTHDYQIRRYGDIGEKLTTGNPFLVLLVSKSWEIIRNANFRDFRKKIPQEMR